MNCESYRDEVLSDPGHVSAALRRHLEICAGCQQYQNQINVFDQRLKMALHVSSLQDVPPAAILHPDHDRRWRRPVVAVAVIILLSLGSLFLFTSSSNRATTTADILQHVAEEPKAFSSQQKVDPGPVFAEIGAILRVNPSWRATYAGRCTIGKKQGLHLVYRRGDEVVTAMVLPGKVETDSNRIGIRYSNGMSIVLVPTAATRPNKILASLQPALYLE